MWTSVNKFEILAILDLNKTIVWIIGRHECLLLPWSSFLLMLLYKGLILTAVKFYGSVVLPLIAWVESLFWISREIRQIFCIILTLPKLAFCKPFLPNFWHCPWVEFPVSVEMFSVVFYPDPCWVNQVLLTGYVLKLVFRYFTGRYVERDITVELVINKLHTPCPGECFFVCARSSDISFIYIWPLYWIYWNEFGATFYGLVLLYYPIISVSYLGIF